MLNYLNLLLKIVAYSACFLGCAYQGIKILNIYFSFPTTMFSFIEQMNTLELPGISVCNNNRIVLSKLRSSMPQFDATWVSLQNRLRQRHNVSATKLEMQHLIDATVRQLMDSLTIYEFSQLGHEWKEIVPQDSFKCATDPFNLNNPCIKHAHVVESVQDEGNCFTFFGHSIDKEFLDSIAITSGFAQSPVIRGSGDTLDLELAEQPFHPNEIFRMIVNFSIYEYTTFNDKIMGYFIVHDQHELPPIREKSFLLYPGYYYEFYLSKESDSYLPAPYWSDCKDYDYSKKVSGFGMDVQSRESCIMDCMADMTIKKCNCWPPEIPYVLKNITESHWLKWCSWRDGININATKEQRGHSSWFHYCFSQQESECKHKCRMQCRSNQYSAIRQSFVWPSKERMEHSTKYTKSFRKCCAVISVRFWSSERELHDYQPKYEFVEFMSYFGGLLSMWLGFSLVKIYDISEMCSRYLYKRMKTFRKTTAMERVAKKNSIAISTAATKPPNNGSIKNSVENIEQISETIPKIIH